MRGPRGRGHRGGFGGHRGGFGPPPPPPRYYRRGGCLGCMFPVMSVILILVACLFIVF